MLQMKQMVPLMIKYNGWAPLWSILLAKGTLMGPNGPKTPLQELEWKGFSPWSL